MAAVGLDQLGHGITGSKSSQDVTKFTVSSVYRLINLTTELTDYLKGTAILKFCVPH
jgi:hypothetical protein